MMSQIKFLFYREIYLNLCQENLILLSPIPPIYRKRNMTACPQGFEILNRKRRCFPALMELSFHREIIKAGGIYLKAGGWSFMEIGAGQKEMVEFMLNESNLYDNIAFRDDYAGIKRVAIARRVTTGG